MQPIGTSQAARALEVKDCLAVVDYALRLVATNMDWDEEVDQ